MTTNHREGRSGAPYRDLATMPPPAPAPVRPALWRSNKVLLLNLLCSITCVIVWLFRLVRVTAYPWEVCISLIVLSWLSGAGQYLEWRHRCRRAARAACGIEG